LAAFLLLYFWITVYAHFKEIRRGSKTGPVEAQSHSSLSDVELEDGSGLRSRATGLDMESVEVENGDRRYLYATTFETLEGMSPLPVFQISPISTPG
jgi:hypothetical protein